MAADKETVERWIAELEWKKIEQQERNKETEQRKREFAHHEAQFIQHTIEWETAKQKWDVEYEKLKDGWKGLVDDQRFAAAFMTLGLGLLIGSINKEDLAITIKRISLAKDEVELSQRLRTFHKTATEHGKLLKLQNEEEQEWLKDISELQKNLIKSLEQMKREEYSDDVKEYQKRVVECNWIIKESEKKTVAINEKIQEFSKKEKQIFEQVIKHESTLSKLTTELEECKQKVDSAIAELNSLSRRYSVATVTAGAGWGTVIGGLIGIVGGPVGVAAGAAIGAIAGTTGTATVDAATAGKKRAELNAAKERTEKIMKDLNAILATCKSEINHLKVISSKEDLVVTHQDRWNFESSPFREAKNEAQVPFLHHKVLQCGCKGLEYTIADHDITLRIPEGVVSELETFHIEIGVSMSGPCTFPDNTQPISPIVWLCLLEEDTKLQKPFRLILPHFLTGLTVEKTKYHQVQFAKAHHTMLDSQTVYDFKPVSTEPLFAVSGPKSYGILETDHCCYYCLEARKSKELVKDTDHCLVRAELTNSLRSEIHFFVTYFLETCLKALEEQLKVGGFPLDKMRHYTFKFKLDDTSQEPSLKLIVPREHSSCTIGLDPYKIMASDVDFWQDSFDTMKLKQKQGVYPPNVIMSVTPNVPHSKFKIPVKFKGCLQKNKLDMDLSFPRVVSDSSTLSSSTSSARRAQSQEVLSKEPTYREAFDELFELAAEWKNIGILIGVEKHVLDQITHDNKKACDCLGEMLSEWFKKRDRSWTDVIKAVEKFNETKADDIYKRIPH